MQPEAEPSSNAKNTRADPDGPSSSKCCTVCGSAKGLPSLLDLSTNKAEVVQKTLCTICVECVCKLNMHSEVTHTIMQRLQRVNDVRTSPASKQDKPASSEHAAAQSRSNSSLCSVLQPYSVQPAESPKANRGNNLDGWKWRTRLVCQYCERAYFRKDLYSLHVRRCWRHHTQRRPQKCRVLNEASHHDDATNAGKLFTRSFQCKHCDMEFTGVLEMRQHQRAVHQLQHRCSVCEASFGTKYEWDMHHTICSAKQEALKTQQEPTQSRSTRARSRACSSAWHNGELADEEDEDDEDDAADSQYDEQDDVSVASTNYKRRMNFTGDWIVNHSRSNSNSALNLTMMYDDYVLEETQITTDKEYDLYLLDLLKTQVQLKAFTCFVPNCRYQTNTLVDLMKHDYIHHWKMSWFYCNKCGDVFTSKVFLDYHLHRQNRGVYICHKCYDEFEFQHQLDRHQLLHSKGINYYCKYCRLEFLSEAKLLAHCEHERHSPNDEPPQIHIDHAISISNTVPAPAAQLRKYTARILNLPQRPWISKRPMVLPNHKPYRFAIGICEFDNRQLPNCVSCT
ncbi:zinc finger protein 761 isoform X2 [Drosophila busckii]|uniref:zinc finger protein 761 isoform X2 n=1 Tax=Drosophila busckii TaxID=30019 RepID=UPI00083F3C29|nr:zinc finger protein 761 isoform X2 [Drosophila busckii]